MARVRQSKPITNPFFSRNASFSNIWNAPPDFTKEYLDLAFNLNG